MEDVQNVVLLQIKYIRFKFEGSNSYLKRGVEDEFPFGGPDSSQVPCYFQGLHLGPQTIKRLHLYHKCFFFMP